MLVYRVWTKKNILLSRQHQHTPSHTAHAHPCIFNTQHGCGYMILFFVLFFNTHLWLQFWRAYNEYGVVFCMSNSMKQITGHFTDEWLQQLTEFVEILNIFPPPDIYQHVTNATIFIEYFCRLTDILKFTHTRTRSTTGHRTAVLEVGNVAKSERNKWEN